MPADSVFAGAKFWAVWKAVVARIVHEGVGFWAVFGPFRGDGARQTAQNSGTMAKMRAFFCKIAQKMGRCAREQGTEVRSRVRHAGEREARAFVCLAFVEPRGYRVAHSCENARNRVGGGARR